MFWVIKRTISSRRFFWVPTTYALLEKYEIYLSLDMRFPTMWYVQPAKAQTSLHIRAVWSEPLLVASIICKAADWTEFGVSKLKRGLHRLVWVYTSKNVTMMEITCHSSYTLSLFEDKDCDIPPIACCRVDVAICNFSLTLPIFSLVPISCSFLKHTLIVIANFFSADG